MTNRMLGFGRGATLILAFIGGPVAAQEERGDDGGGVRPYERLGWMQGSPAA